MRQVWVGLFLSRFDHGVESGFLCMDWCNGTDGGSLLGLLSARVEKSGILFAKCTIAMGVHS